MTPAVIRRRSSVRPVAITVSLFAALATPAVPQGRRPEGPERIHVKVRIDGLDQLHVAHRSARWTHLAWQMPEQVEINGRQWDPRGELQVPATEPLLAPRIELCGAVLRKVAGRGEVSLAMDEAGLVIRFDDSTPTGSDEYEVVIEFAPVLCREDRQRRASAEPVELRIRAHVDGTEEIRFTGTTARWIHHEWEWPTDVEVNGRAWAPSKSQLFELDDVLPAVPDFAEARVERFRGRGSVELVPWRGELALSLDDREGGADTYEVKVTIPPRPPRHLLTVEIDAPGEPAPGTLRVMCPDPPMRVLRDAVLDASGRSRLAVDDRPLLLEQLRAESSGVVQVSAGPLEVRSDMTVRISATSSGPLTAVGPEGRPFTIDEIAVRSELSRAEAVWRRGPQSPAAPTLSLSAGAWPRLRIFGHSGVQRFAAWTDAGSTRRGRVVIPEKDWVRCTFAFAPGTPDAVRTIVVLHFPDAVLEIPDPQDVELFTNRRCFGVAYRLELPDGRVAVFRPRLVNIAARESSARIALGGQPSPRGAAIVLEDERVGGRRMWFDIVLTDATGSVLDEAASRIDWQQSVALADGSALPEGALDDVMVGQLTPTTEHVVLRCSWNLDERGEASLAPAPLVTVDSARCSTTVPGWLADHARSYLGKIERILDGIARVRGAPLPEDHRIPVRWWLNSGAVGGGGGIAMPVQQLLDADEPFAHPWALTHEILHTLGYRHGFALNRIDAEVQDLFERARWRAGSDATWTDPRDG